MSRIEQDEALQQQLEIVTKERDALKEACFDALVLCNGLGREWTTISHEGRKDTEFCVTDKLRAALILCQ